jgi:hypothetical protein
MGLLGGFGDANGAAGAFAGAGVSAGALAADGQTLAMTDAAVTIDGLEALEVTGEFAAEVTLHHPLVLGDDVEDFVELLLGKILGAHVSVETGLGDDLVGALRADAVDVTEGVRDFLFRGNFNTKETWHGRKVVGSELKKFGYGKC